MTPSTRLLSRSIALSTRPATARRQALAVFRQSSSLVLGVKRSKVWSEMPKAVQQHWRALGWTPSSWEGHATPPLSVDKDWDDLSTAELTAAKALGYDYHRWENDPEDPFTALPKWEFEPKKKSSVALPAAVVAMKSQTWDGLTADQRGHWTQLGWRREVWDGGVGSPSSSTMEYSKLSARGQAAARALGYTEQTWDADDGDGGGGSQGGSYAKFNRETAAAESGLGIGSMLKFALAAGGLAGLWVVSGVWDAQSQRAKADRLGGGTTHLTRMAETPRPGWKDKVKKAGLTFAELPGVYWGWPTLFDFLWPLGLVRRLGLDEPYWNESASYRLSDEGAWKVESATSPAISLLP